MVSSYISSVVLNTVTVVPSSGDTTHGKEVLRLRQLLLHAGTSMGSGWSTAVHWASLRSVCRAGGVGSSMVTLAADQGEIANGSPLPQEGKAM